MSLITCLAMTNDCNVIAYGCYNGSVRLYYLHSGSVKTLGSHQGKVMDLSVTLEIMPDTKTEMVVVVSGSKDGSLVIWWDGGCFQIIAQITEKAQNFHSRGKYSALQNKPTFLGFSYKMPIDARVENYLNVMINAPILLN